MEVNAAWFCDSWRELPLVARQAVMRRLPALSSGSQCLDRSRCRNISAFSPFLKTVSASTHQYAGWLSGLSSAAASAGPPVVSQQFQQLLPCGRDSIWSCCLITVWGWFKNLLLILCFWSAHFSSKESLSSISTKKSHLEERICVVAQFAWHVVRSNTLDNLTLNPLCLLSVPFCGALCRFIIPFSQLRLTTPVFVATRILSLQQFNLWNGS